MPFFRGTFFGKYGIIGIQFYQSGKANRIMGIHFAKRIKIGSIICMNLKQCDESGIFMNDNVFTLRLCIFLVSDTEL